MTDTITSCKQIRETAKARALRYARSFNRPMYVFATPQGLKIDVMQPTIGMYSVATPNGEYCNVRPKIA